jgi:hypothetical protein
VTLLPWVSNHRERTTDPKYLDCTTCRERYPESTRQAWACGFLAETDRLGPPPVPRGYPGSPSVCPGYLVSMPIVAEVADARFWAERGLLEARYRPEELSDRVFDAVRALEMEVQAVEAYELKRWKEEQDRQQRNQR